MSTPHYKSKSDLYDSLVLQVEVMVEAISHRLTPQANLVLTLSNVSALCFYEMNQFSNPEATLHTVEVNWFGFYLLQAPGTLALGPFQGRPACTTIHVGRGVCGIAVDAAKSLVVPDVLQFPGHIACDSDSKSEVVVPIKIENGSIVGVIDVDSRLHAHFDEEDVKGLEKVAELLSKHLEFPMSRALTVNPALAFSNFSPIPSGVPLPGETPPPSSTPPTKVTGIPFMKIEPALPDKTEKCVGNWRFTMTRLARIASQAELSDLEERLGFTSFPEILFLGNTLTVSVNTSERPLLHFSAESILRSAKSFYDSDQFKKEVNDIIIPVSEGWKTSSYDKHDPKVDWGWRNDCFALGPSATLVPRTEGDGINWELLRNTNLEIVFFDSFDLFEDDLHDNGMIVCSVKFRVMNEAFFILFRHYVRVDGHELWCRDVRYYHEFNVKRGDVPSIVVREEVKKLSSIENIESIHTVPVDKLLADANLIREAEYYVEFS